MHIINPPFQSPSINSLLLQIYQDPLFELALEALKLKASHIHDYDQLELKFSSCRELIRECAKDIFIIEEKIQWYKTCQNWHEIKLDGGLNNEQAKQIAREKHDEYEAKKIYSKITTEVRGHYDPFIKFMHVDNCPECDSKPIRVFHRERTPVTYLLDNIEKKANCSEFEIEDLYKKISQYIFYLEDQ